MEADAMHIRAASTDRFPLGGNAKTAPRPAGFDEVNPSRAWSRLRKGLNYRWFRGFQTTNALLRGIGTRSRR
ncbi:hypothetical protein SAMN02799641_03902 [Rhodococcus erythropolis]|nr:hypothetical protein [Rhodococcus erythropolis]MCW2429047.1 hypothetical protein [Rhodococcus erythropolis]SCY95383.1 hypothetical protein SAMN02799641_03902 [Rhodococcus erythropolis]SUE08733.1 Uncharacterised protein [Rhodococcus erythropolis]